MINQKNNQLTIENTWGSVPAGEEQKGIISFEVTVDELGNPVALDYFTLDGTATYGEDYIAFEDSENETQATGSIELNSNDLTAEIELTLLGDTPVNPLGTEQNNNFEIFSKDTVNRTWVSGQDISYNPQTGEQLSYGDLGYRVNEFFNDQKTGFQAVGLTSDEIFFVIITDPSGKVLQENADIGQNLLNEIETALGGNLDTLKDKKSQEIYQNAQNTIEQLEQNDTNWTFATGTTYDLGKAPVLVFRGTQVSDKAANNSLDDVFSDTNPKGIGFDQFFKNKEQIFTWLDEVRSPETDLTFAPHITGHSLGAALTQWAAANYNNKMGQIVTFSPPGIAENTFNEIKGANDFDQNNVASVTHYISSGDIVSVAGEEHIDGEYILSIFPTAENIDVANVFDLMLKLHILPVITEQIDLNLVALSEGNDSSEPMVKPAGLTQNEPQPINDFDSQNYNYPTDPNFIDILNAIASDDFTKYLQDKLKTKEKDLGPRVAAAMYSRDTVEEIRQEIGGSLFGKDGLQKSTILPKKSAFGLAVRKAIINLPDATPPLNFTGQANSPLKLVQHQAVTEIIVEEDGSFYFAFEPHAINNAIVNGVDLEPASELISNIAALFTDDGSSDISDDLITAQTALGLHDGTRETHLISLMETLTIDHNGESIDLKEMIEKALTNGNFELFPLPGSDQEGLMVKYEDLNQSPFAGSVLVDSEGNVKSNGKIDLGIADLDSNLVTTEDQAVVLITQDNLNGISSDDQVLLKLDNLPITETLEGGEQVEFIYAAGHAVTKETTPIETIFGTPETDVIQLPNKEAPQLVFAGDGDDFVDTTSAYKFDLQHLVYGGLGNDIITAGSRDILLGNEGDDAFYMTSGGDNILTGGSGADQFWLASAEYPATMNQITDFELGVDVLGIGGLGLEFADLTLTQADNNTVVSISSNGLELASLVGINPEQLSADNFVFV